MTPPPEKLEHYELLKNEDGTVIELGRGAMGITYKAFDTNLRCHVALKVIKGAHLDDPAVEERFLREARGAAQLRHRNVASVFHLGRHGESFFYAMEFIAGETVDERVRREGPLPPLLSLEIAAQVASALIAAHKQGLVHRDIKPSNLMLVREGDGELLVKLIDFGLVKSALIGSTSGGLTESGFVGTPYFASPEQLDQRTEDIRSDIYSLGITLWFMLTGKPTFMGSVASVIAQHLDKVPAFESLAVLPACLVGVLRKMLAKDVNERLQTPQELRAELKRCLEKLKAAKTGDAAATMVPQEEARETIGLSSTHGLRPRARAGSVLGERYRLIEDLAPDEPGRSFHAEDVPQKRRVRVRVVPCEAAAFADVQAQVTRLEAATHRHFISVLAAAHTGGFGYVVFEWLEGFALVDLLRARHELTLRETLTLLEQIAPTVDAARDIGVRLALGLHDIFIHFPEAFSEQSEEVILRCPLAEWPAFLVKLDPLGSLAELDDLHADCERTIVTPPEHVRPTPLAQVAALAYDLLGGKPGASAPLANVSEEGNDALRRALTGRDSLASAVAFVEALRRSEVEELRANAPAPPGILRRPVASVLRRAPAEESAVTRSEPPPETPAHSPRARKISSPIDRARMLWTRHRIALLASAGTILLLIAILALARPRREARLAPAPPTPAATPVPVVAQRQPPRPGQPWKNSLDMRYVPVSAVHFSTHETRVKDFAAFVAATQYDAEGGMYSLQRGGFKQHGHSWKKPGFEQSPEHPVVGVSYEDAKYFCDWLTRKERGEGALGSGQMYRLPTDREWSEAAGFVNEPGATPEARSGKIKAFAWGAGPLRNNAANFAGTEAAAGAPTGWPVLAGYQDAAPRTCVVPGYGPNARGIYDLGGNVWEWCQDRFNKTTNWRVLRGGAWSTARQAELSLSARRGYDPTFRHDDVGFRCVIASDDGTR